MIHISSEAKRLGTKNTFQYAFHFKWDSLKFKTRFWLNSQNFERNKSGTPYFILVSGAKEHKLSVSRDTWYWLKLPVTPIYQGIGDHKRNKHSCSMFCLDLHINSWLLQGYSQPCILLPNNASYEMERIASLQGRLQLIFILPYDTWICLAICHLTFLLSMYLIWTTYFPFSINVFKKKKKQKKSATQVESIISSWPSITFERNSISL